MFIGIRCNNLILSVKLPVLEKFFLTYKYIIKNTSQAFGIAIIIQRKLD